MLGVPKGWHGKKTPTCGVWLWSGVRKHQGAGTAGSLMIQDTSATIPKVNTFAIGDRVTLRRIPDPVTQDRAKFPETYDLMKLAVGRSYRIRSFNDYGMAEIWLNDDASEGGRGFAQSLWIEQEYLARVDR